MCEQSEWEFFLGAERKQHYQIPLFFAELKKAKDAAFCYSLLMVKAC